MKLVMDEKLKHRLIGVAVIVSLGAIFAPALMKKSSHHLDSRVNVQLPPKPSAPQVAITEEKELFKTIKIAKVKIPAVSSENHLSELAKAEPIKSDLVQENKVIKFAQDTSAEELNKKSVNLAVNEAAKTTAKHSVIVAVNKPIKRAPVIALKPRAIPKNNQLAVNTNKKLKLKTDVYAVQLASFSQLSNAQALVNKLKNKGYKATFTKVSSKKGAVYKVYAGHSPRKGDVLKVKTQLASGMQLSGFIVNTGVS
ncbi:MAG: SPOR domain-containing protein [bacterium]|nr:SPOR domain-containing protein [bacterium]